ncbi:MAG: gamma-glutamylcyclotransferase, partial [Methylobacterium mesophilicum]|nr:gamma-glutamylcyclotransferase [Methylobacterium mesophilicum]
AETGSAILQSYLDAVLQGFLAVHGEAGLRRFVSETQGFETMVIRDRAKPRYPRSVVLQPGEAERFDQLLLSRGARFQEE